jgi:hypothetical protein
VERYYRAGAGRGGFGGGRDSGALSRRRSRRGAPEEVLAGAPPPIPFSSPARGFCGLKDSLSTSCKTDRARSGASNSFDSLFGDGFADS